MPKINIKLGRSFSDELPSLKDIEEKQHFPSFHIESDEKLDLPHSGEMTIKFRKTGFSMREDSDGDATYSCDVEVHEIVSAYSDEPEAPARSHSNEAGEALDALRRTKKKSVDY